MKKKLYQHDFRGPGVCYECCTRCGISFYEIVRDGLHECISDEAARERREMAAAQEAAAWQMAKLRRGRRPQLG